MVRLAELAHYGQGTFTLRGGGGLQCMFGGHPELSEKTRVVHSFVSRFRSIVAGNRVIDAGHA